MVAFTTPPPTYYSQPPHRCCFISSSRPPPSLSPHSRGDTYHHHPLQLKIMMMMMMFCLFTTSTPLLPLTATADMPTTISNGYFRCEGPSIDCTVTSTTTVDVYNAIVSAYSAGNTSATFTAINPTIDGYLLFKCSTTPYSFAVHILVENGVGTTNNLAYFMGFEGTLSQSSTVIVRAGSYFSNSASSVGLFRIYGAAQLQGNMLLQITGQSLVNVRIFEITASLSLYDGSIVDLSNTILTSNETGIAVSLFEAQLYVSESSTFYLRNISCEMNDANVSILMLFYSSSSIYLETGTLKISNNTISALTDTINSPSGLVDVSYYIYVITGSHFNISHNVVNVRGKGSGVVLLPRSWFQVLSGSSFEISDNILNLSSTDTYVSLINPGGDITITDSNFSTINNIIHVESDTTIMYFLRGFAVSAKSIVSFVSNTMNAASKSSVVVFQCTGDFTFDDSSALYFQHNNFTVVLSTTKVFTTLLFSCIALYDTFAVRSNGLIHVSNNAIDNTGTTAFGSVITAIMSLSVDTTICRNNSSILLTNNILNIRHKVGLTSSIYLIYFQTGSVSVLSDSSFKITNNDVTAEMQSTYSRYVLSLLYVKVGVVISGESSVVVDRNVVTAPSLMGRSSITVLSSFAWHSETLTVSNGELTITTNTFLITCKSASSVTLFGTTIVTLSNGAQVNYSENLLNFTMADAISSEVVVVAFSTLMVSEGSTFVMLNDTLLVGFSDDDVPEYELSNFTHAIAGSLIKFTNSTVSKTGAIHVEGCQMSAYHPNTPFSAILAEIGAGDSDVLFTSGGGITIRSNTIDVCRYAGRLLSVGTSTGNSSSTLTLANNGTFMRMSNNTMSTSSQCNQNNTSSSSSSSLIAMLIKSDLYINSTATMTISDNNLNNLHLGGGAGISTCVTMNNLHLSGTLDVHGNTVVGSVQNATMGQEGSINVLGTAEGSVAQFRFVDNKMTLTAIGLLRERKSVFDDVYVVFLNLSSSTSGSSSNGSPLVVIANNTAVWTGNTDTRGNTGAIFAYLVFTGVLIPGEVIHLINNTMTTTDLAPVHGLYLEMPPTPSSSSPVAILNNNHLASGVGTPAWTALVLNTSSVDVSTCGNTIESRQCGGGCEGNHPCIAYNRSRVNDCHTATCTTSRTTTSSGSHSPSTTLTPPRTSTFTTSNSINTPSQNTHSSTRTSSPSTTLSISTTYTPSFSDTHPTSSPTSPTTISHNTITMSLSDSAPTPTPGRTRSTTVVNPGDPCQMGCLAVRGVQLDGDIIATSGCGTVAFVPFISTENGKLAELVILLNDDARQRINASYDVGPGGGVPLGVDLIREVHGAEVSADLMGLREGPEYREVRLHVGRRDITPLLRIVVRVSLPWAGFLCRENTSATGGGLPWVDIELEAPPAILQGASLAAVMVMGAASGALVGADLQTVAAMGMLGCAPRGSDSGVRDNVRALVPTALSNTCEGAIGGAVTTLVAVVVVSAIAVLVYRRIKTQVPLVQACASMYCPSVALSIWGMLQTGLLVCGGQLMLTGGSSSFPGIVGLAFGLGIVPCYVVLADRIVSRRCYRMAPNNTAPGGQCGHRVMCFFLPTYELDKKEMPASQAFSAVVARTRYSQSVWAAVWVSPPITLLLCVFARGELCKPMYMTAASCLVILAILHIAFRPNRSIFNNFLTAAALLINAALVGVGALLAYDPLDSDLQNASYALSLAQTVLTAIRLTITATSFVIMKTRRSKWYTLQEPDGRPTKPDTKATPVFTVVGWLDPPLNAFGVPLEEFNDINIFTADNNHQDDGGEADLISLDDGDYDVDHDDDLAPGGTYAAPALLTKDAIEEEGSAALPPRKSRFAREGVDGDEEPDPVPTDRSDPSYTEVRSGSVEFGDGSGFKSECLIQGEQLTVLNNLLDNYHNDGAMRLTELPYTLRDEEQEEDEEEMQSQEDDPNNSNNYQHGLDDDDDDTTATPPLELSDTLLPTLTDVNNRRQGSTNYIAVGDENIIENDGLNEVIIITSDDDDGLL